MLTIKGILPKLKFSARKKDLASTWFRSTVWGELPSSVWACPRNCNIFIFNNSNRVENAKQYWCRIKFRLQIDEQRVNEECFWSLHKGNPLHTSPLLLYH